jgi:rhomboid protease GluP
VRRQARVRLVGPVLLRLSSDFRRAMDLSLVLDEEGVPHELRSFGDEQWGLFVEDEHALRAGEALAAFERENEARPGPDEPPPLADGIWAALWFVVPIAAVYLAADARWIAAGEADAGAIVRGQAFRALTALTLHEDAAHAAGNAFLGAVFVGLLARRLGTGAALLVTLLAGAFGTAATALVMRREFVSIGASTAVFGALGALSVLPERRGRKLAAAVALLGFLGTGKRADLLGHLAGFAAGLGLGFAAGFWARLAARARRPLRSQLAQLALGLASLAALCVAWLRALG